MGDERIDAIKARLDAATPGPWEADWLEWEDDGEDAHFTHIVRAPGRDSGNGSEIVCDVGESPRRKTLPDAAFIANAPDDVGWLLERVETLEAAAKAVLAVSACDICYEDECGHDCSCPCHIAVEHARQTARAALSPSTAELRQEEVEE